jgi:lysophospholipid acyltransferase (LPLAT)-like uncharacterized protein
MSLRAVRKTVRMGSALRKEKKKTPLQRLVRAPWFGSFAATPFVLWARFCNATTRWQVHGRDELCADLARGPVVMITWHNEILMVPMHFPPGNQVVTINDPSPIGNVAAGYCRWFGLRTISMQRRKSPASTLLAARRAVAAGATLGLTADGPRGPALQVTEAASKWVGLSREPVWTYCAVQNREWRLTSWDRTRFPRPFTRGAMVFRRWQDEPGRDRAGSLREALKLALDQTEAAATAAAKRR